MATTGHVAYCFEALAAQLEGTALPKYTAEDAAEEYPLFVTWNITRPGGTSSRLRGCIGSFTALPLANGLRDYALISALKDHRFNPIASSELPRLECVVSLLTDFEDVSDPFDWEIGQHGIYIYFEDPATVKSYPPVVDSPASASSTSSTDANQGSSSLKNRLASLTASPRKKRGANTLTATYLPEVAAEQGWNKIETLDSAMRKAGYSGKITDAMRQSVRVTRYSSSKIGMKYTEWKKAEAAS